LIEPVIEQKGQHVQALSCRRVAIHVQECIYVSSQRSASIAGQGAQWNDSLASLNGFVKLKMLREVVVALNC